MGTTYSEGFATVNGLQMYYQVHGTGGTPLVLLHGGGSTIETTFAIMLPLLSKTRMVIAADLQAHGRTSDRQEASSFQQDADDIAMLLQHLHIPKADVLGFSNGGSTALQLAIRHPALVHKIVAISAIYKREGMLPGFFEGMQHATLYNMPLPLKEAFLKVTPNEAGLKAMFERDKDRMLGFKDWNDSELSQIQAPTLLMVSNKDVVLPAHAFAMANQIPTSEVVVLPGIHGACIGEICTDKPGSKLPEATAIIIDEFLNG